MNSFKTFEIYTYQILPINRYAEEDLLDGPKTIEELLGQKNHLFWEGLKRVVKLENKHTTISYKPSNILEDFAILDIAPRRERHLGTIDFKDRLEDDWPSVKVFMWNHEDIQCILVQKKVVAFQKTKTVANMLIKAINYKIKGANLKAVVKNKFEASEFWDIIKENKNKIEKVTFDMITPNMASISKSLDKSIVEVSKKTNAHNSKFVLQADDGSVLNLSKDDEQIKGLVEYSSEGGSSIDLKIKGIKKHYSTSKTNKSVEISELELSGAPEDVEKIIKDILK